MTKLSTRRAMAFGLAGIAALIVAVQVYPSPLFGYSRSYRGLDIHSDTAIDPSITRVIDDTVRRLATSSMYGRGDRFRVFICNSPWRLRFFAYGSGIGGGTAYATRNIFIRAADIPANAVLAPGGDILLDQHHRPLSYFIAHEAAHVLLLRRFGTIATLRAPSWIVEGYADHVAKAGDFDVAENRALLRRGDALLGIEMARHGLYRRYQLMVETALERRGATIDTGFAAPPNGDDVLRDANR